MRHSILAVLLALSLVLAGCNGLALGDEETPARTLTPAPVPTDRPTPTPVPQLAPGLTGEGVTDVSALAEAHAAVLANISYTLSRNTTVQYANGTLRGRLVTTTRVARNHSRFYLVQDIVGPKPPFYNFSGPARLEWFSNGERLLAAYTRNNNTTYDVMPSEEPLNPTTGGEQFYTLFNAVETRVTDRETRDGTTLYRVESAELVNPSAFTLGGRYEYENVRNVTLVAFVDSRGLVREYRLNYAATLDNSTVRVHRRVRYTDLGNTTVERPPWYEAAIENATTTG